jgi:hypothetical protein
MWEVLFIVIRKRFGDIGMYVRLDRRLDDEESNLNDSNLGDCVEKVLFECKGPMQGNFSPSKPIG